MVAYRSISPVLVSHLWLLLHLILTSILFGIVLLSSLTKDEWLCEIHSMYQPLNLLDTGNLEPGTTIGAVGEMYLPAVCINDITHN